PRVAGLCWGEWGIVGKSGGVWWGVVEWSKTQGNRLWRDGGKVGMYSATFELEGKTG
nr:hypothetical protein [Tanacetum cinerariifolium]